jgi:hypothetical protein
MVVQELLDEADGRSSGKIVRRDFRIALEGAGLELSLDEVKSLFKTFESAEEGFIDYQAFLAAMEKKEEAGPKDKKVDPLQAVVAKIRSALKKEGRRAQSLRKRLERADERAKG